MSRCNPKLPRLSRLLLRIFLREDEYAEKSGDLEEVYSYLALEIGPFRAKAWLWFQVLKAAPVFVLNSICWRWLMFNNYIKITLRNITKYKGYSFINIFGLATGIASCLLIFLFVTEEISYDNYHKDKERIFRISTHYETKSFSGDWAAIGPAVGPFIKKDFPQVEYAARIFRISEPLVKKDDRMFYEERVFYTDQDLLNIFSINFIHGNPAGALTRPNTVVLSQRMARKYFGQEIPIGNTITINGEAFEITGVAENHPSNTHFKYELLVSLESFEEAKRFFPNWGWTTFRTYVKLAPQVDSKRFENLIRDLEKNYETQEEMEKRISKNSYFFQPITDIHLHSNIRGEIETPGNPLYVSGTGVIGLLILLIACINFMNLSTARFANRAKEVGLRKVVGAQRRQLICQFLGEAFLMSLIAFFIAFSIATTVLPLFNDISGKEFVFNDLLNLKILFVSVVLIVIVGFFSGSYPAFCLSMFKPGTIFQSGRTSGSGSSLLRKILVVGQFTISVALLIGTFVVYTQLNFMKNKDLGFDKEQKLFLSWSRNSSLSENYKNVKAEFLQLSSIKGATVSSAIPGYGIYGWQVGIVGEADQKIQFFNVCLIDDDFIPEFKIEMAAGRAFIKELSTDIEGPLIINETAVKSLGWHSSEEALGKHLRGGPADGLVIGIMKDFHFSDVQEKIGPLVMVYSPEYFDSVTLTMDVANSEKTVSLVKEKWQELNPDGLFTYRFVDSIFDTFYRSNERTGKLFSIFTFLGIFISCLGLFGLTSYTTERRKKEIGIRKTLGASVTGIAVLLSNEFIKWVALAIIVATPLAYFVMDKWLQNFAYRINISVWIFIFSAVIAILISLITVCFQTIKAALANPVDSLRYE